MKLNRLAMTGGALALLAILFVAVTTISNTALRGVRLDLTQKHLYTLSDGTRRVLVGIDEPIHLTLFYSDRGTQGLPQLRTYASRVREMLEEMATRARGKIRFEVVDPLPFSEDEDRASALGLLAIPAGVSGDNIFFGLVGTNSTNGQAVIAFFQPDKEAFLEYDIAKVIHQLSTPKKPVLGLISSLPLGGGIDPVTQQMRDPWAVQQQLAQLFEVRALGSAELKAIDPDINVLMLVHPKHLPDATLYAIDQFVLRGGHLLVFVDPEAELDDSGADPNNPAALLQADRSSDLPRLFKAWGVEYDPNKVVLDRAHALAIATAPGAAPLRHPAILGFTRTDMNPNDVLTAKLDSINASTVGFIQMAKDAPLTLVPLIQTSADAMTVPSARVRMLADAASLLDDYQPGGERYVVAGRLQGDLHSAFPERSGADHLAASSAPADMVVVADTDLLSDRLWVQVQAFYGEKLFSAFANNGDFVVNAVDNLAGSDDLISIRGRATSQRPFTTVDNLKRAAEVRYRAKEQELQTELVDTEAKLNALQTGKSEDSALILSAQQKTEIENFQKRKLEIRKELRQVRRQLDAEIETLGTRLKLIDIGLMPLLVTIAALAFAWWKARRRRVA